jgi:hypothetical protein
MITTKNCCVCGGPYLEDSVRPFSLPMCSRPKCANAAKRIAKEMDRAERRRQWGEFFGFPEQGDIHA